MLYIPIGKYTDNPYYLEELGVSIHSVEELCYFLKENATSLEETIMRQTLCDFITRELELPQLGGALTDLVANKGSLAAFVRLILEKSGYVSREELRSIDSMLRKNSAMGSGEKRKSHGDYHLCAGRYLMAEREYRQALADMDEESDPQLFAAANHNLGCALAMMQLYDPAADCFKRAYEAGHGDESYMSYLAALRLGRSREEYTRLINSFRLDQSRVARLENELQGIFAQAAPGEARSLKEALEKKGGTEELLEAWKSDIKAAMEIE